MDPEETLELRLYTDTGLTHQVGSTVSVTIKAPSVGVITEGNDVITGTNAGELLSGVPLASLARGRGSVDRLTGGGGADIFKLADASGSYYLGQGNNDLAVITDFTAGDKIQLHGNASNYVLVSGRYDGIKGIRIDSLGTPTDPVGFVVGATLASLNLTNPNQFLYV